MQDEKFILAGDKVSGSYIELDDTIVSSFSVDVLKRYDINYDRIEDFELMVSDFRYFGGMLGTAHTKITPFEGCDILTDTTSKSLIIGNGLMNLIPLIRCYNRDYIPLRSWKREKEYQAMESGLTQLLLPSAIIV